MTLPPLPLPDVDGVDEMDLSSENTSNKLNLSYKKKLPLPINADDILNENSAGSMNN